MKNEVLIQLKNTHHIQASINYQLGGLNWFTVKQEPRGYFLSITTIEREETEYGIRTSYVLGSGIKTLLLPVTRQSAKQAAQALASVSNVVETIARMVHKVLVDADNAFLKGQRFNPLSETDEDEDSPFHPEQSIEFAKVIAEQFKKLSSN